ncbi:hypothetical protein [Clostridium sp.]|uniref:hypothetical protein n=1 Tax=Clostridium sp. TaxID=1506 RepID=UPI00284F3DF0|nr:hypothetical protein [Clostridium sp.]MDR3598771.1 hypothetical protein [Clostridium sp.]
MPTLISELLKSQNLILTGKVKWGNPFFSNNQGIYIVSSSGDGNINAGISTNAPISLERIQFWLNKVLTFELDKKDNPEAQLVYQRLSKFWLPDENILYIGMTNSALSVRVSQYYNTEIGERRPHAGGHWLKTLSNLNDLYIYYSECKNPGIVESNLMDFFSRNVSKESVENLYDSSIILPFANLEHPSKGRKRHGLGKSKLKN